MQRNIGHIVKRFVRFADVVGTIIIVDKGVVGSCEFLDSRWLFGFFVPPFLETLSPPWLDAFSTSVV